MATADNDRWGGCGVGGSRGDVGGLVLWLGGTDMWFYWVSEYTRSCCLE